MQREQIEAVLTDPDGAYQRLHRVMDAWAALWSWPVTTDVAPPTRAQWLGAPGDAARHRQQEPRPKPAVACSPTSRPGTTWTSPSTTTGPGVRPVRSLEFWTSTRGCSVCEQIGRREGFFHWELTFGPVFARGGGFDLQLGNPPWVRPDWDDTLTLAEADAWFGLAEKPSVAAVRDRRAAALTSSY